MLQVDAANEDNDKDRMRARIKAVLDYEILEVKNNQERAIRFTCDNRLLGVLPWILRRR